MDMVMKSYESESITGLRLLLTIIFKSKRENSQPSFTRSYEASEPKNRDLAKKVCVPHRHVDYGYPFAYSLIVTIPRIITNFINESQILKPYQTFNNNIGLFFSSPQNGNTIFLGSTLGHQLSLIYTFLRPFLYSNLISHLGQSSSPFCNNNNNNNNFKNEIQLGNFMRQMVEDSALYMYRLVDCSLQGSSTSLIILTDSNRFEDFRLVTQEFAGLTQAIVYYTTHETHNNYRDMWLDVDNMSYEELLALEDHIGYVSTGLSEEEALTSLKRSKYFLITEEDSQKEFCSICQEEYLEEDELGTLDCSHNFHITCIKQWLGYKNLCPICKSTGLYIHTLQLSLPNN